MRLDSLNEVQRWVMTWCGNALVIKPAELAKSVREAAQRILKTENERQGRDVFRKSNKPIAGRAGEG